MELSKILFFLSFIIAVGGAIFQIVSFQSLKSSDTRPKAHKMLFISLIFWLVAIMTMAASRGVLVDILNKL